MATKGRVSGTAAKAAATEVKKVAATSTTKKAAPVVAAKKPTVKAAAPVAKTVTQKAPAAKPVISKAPTKAAAKPAAKAATTPAAKPAIKAAAKVAAKPIAKPAVKAVAKPVAKKAPAVKPAAKVVAKPAAKATTKAAAKPAAKEATKPAEKQAAQATQAKPSSSTQTERPQQATPTSPFEQLQNMFKGLEDPSALLGVWQQFAQKFPSLSTMGGANGSGAPFGGLNSQAADIAKLVSTEDLERLQSEYLREMSVLWQNYIQQQGVEITDRRFASPAWRNNAWANYLAQSYLINARLMLELAECVQTDPKAKTRIRFAVMQWVDSLAPSNFFVTNPEAQQKLLDTQGESLKMGINNFLTDLQKGRISQTDETAFEIGVNVARSDGAVIYENQYFQLLQYTPLTETVGERPLLIVPPCINKFYIMDLQPDNSLVRHAVEAGNTVYLVSWRNVDESLAQTSWDDYIEDVVIRAIDVVQDASGQEKINILGFCVGGTLLSTALAVLAARGKSPAASLTLLTTLLDFSDNGVLDAYIDEQHVQQREQAFGGGGVMQGKELANAFATLRPNDLVWNYVVSNYLKGEQPTAFDLLYWNSDSTNLPGPMFCWYLRNTYLENRLIKGETVCCGEKVDLSRINAPTYILSCREDHIVPWTAAFRSQEILTGDKRFVLAASGHIAGVINSAKKNKRNYWVNPKADLSGDSDKWLETADEHPGSWWTDWTNWLKNYSGKAVKSPNKLGTTKYKPIEVAPGRYVKARAA